MRAPFCPDTMDMTSEDQTILGSEEKYSVSRNGLESPLVKKHSSKTEVFGICLDSLMGKTPEQTVPYVLSRLCCYIEKHGLNHENLFRENKEKCISEHLKAMFNDSGDAPLETVGDVPSVSRLLKHFFEELPEPLIPVSIVDEMEKLIHNQDDCVSHLKCLVDRLPDSTFHVLKYFSRFLLKVATHQETNGMSAFNLGIVFGPLLFRPSHEDPLVSLIIKNVINYFVSDYYAIFEGDAELSSTEDAVSSQTSKSVFKAAISRRQVPPYPSSVMPLVPLQPLSVVIPPVDSMLQAGDQRTEGNKRVPILLIDSQTEKLSEQSVISQMCIEENGSTRDKNDNPVPSTRKRKERRPSGDELQPQRSSSEERPSPVSDDSMEKREFMRRCSSHEEMKELAKQAFGVSYKKDCIEKISQGAEKDLKGIGPYFAEPLQQNVSNRDHSPHPPKPKRRELDSSDYQQSDQKNQNDCVKQHSSCDTYSSTLHSRSWRNSNNYSSTASNKIMPLKEINLLNFDLSVHSIENSTNNELETEQDSGGFPEDTIMDCSTPEEFQQRKELSDKYKSDSVNTEDILGSIKAGLSRSSSCQIPKKEDTSSDTKDSESDNSLSLSWNMLFESEDNEPLRSEHRFSWPLLKGIQEDDALLSPSVHHLRKSNSYEAPLSPSAYRSYLSYRSSHLDPSVPPSPPVEQENFGKSPLKEDAVSASIKQLTKKIHSLKKKIRRFEEAFETEYGYKPSHTEKTNHPEGKTLMTDLNKARKELKSLKEEAQLMSSVASEAHWHPNREIHVLDATNCSREENSNAKGLKLKPSLESSLDETLKILADERRLAKRPELVEDMTTEQVYDEKIAIQKALLQFESIHGRPARKSERNTMRPLYDRYRNLKRLLVRSGSFGNVLKSKDSCTELQPILEHETMDFTSPQHRKSRETLCSDEITEEIKEKTPILTEVYPENNKITHKSSVALQFLATKYNNSNLHELPLSELLFQQQQARLEKRRLRKILREFEEEFKKLNGRKVQKEDRTPVDTVYAEYKHVKARVRLLEALVSKHDQHQLT